MLGESRPVDPGLHHVVATRGTDSAASDVSVAVDAKVQVVLRFDVAHQAAVSTAPEAPAVAPAKAEPPPAPPAPAFAPVMHGSTASTLGWVGAGVGAAGLVFGGVTGVIALGKRSGINGNASCENMHCLPSERGKVDSYNSMRTLSSVGFVAGGVLAASGIVLLLAAPRHDFTTAALMVTPNAAAFLGQF
jgi:hypothetical protein